MKAQVEEAINQISSCSLSSLNCKINHPNFEIISFFCEKAAEGYTQEQIEEFMEEGIASKKFRKYMLKQLVKDSKVSPELTKNPPSLDYTFEKFLEYKGGK